MTAPRRYRSSEEDSDRWRRFPFREGDVVVSTRSKSGTTWVQQICLSLVHGSPALPAPLGQLSPWVDWLTEPEEVLFSRLDAQPGRRVVKTHTPLDGVVIDPRAAYVVVVRDPLDMAVSLYHQGDNLDRQRIAELTGRTASAPSPRPPLSDWLVRWTTDEADPMLSMDSLAGVVHHAADAWARADGERVLVVRYEGLVADLEGQMRWLADRLGSCSTRRFGRRSLPERPLPACEPRPPNGRRVIAACSRTLPPSSGAAPQGRVARSLRWRTWPPTSGRCATCSPPRRSTTRLGC